MLEGGETVVVTDSSDPEFWIGFMQNTPDTVGAFPAAYVEFESDVSSSSESGESDDEGQDLRSTLAAADKETEPTGNVASGQSKATTPEPEPATEPETEPATEAPMIKCRALFEYEATEITDVAVSALNSLEICGKSLEVKREPASISAAPAAAAAAPTPAAEPEPKPEPAKLYTVELRGVATEEHLADENENKTILAEIEQECAELGDVYRVLLERPPTGPTAADERALAELTGKVFGTALVSFGERSDALRCKQALDGRKYDGRVVEAVPQWDEVGLG